MHRTVTLQDVEFFGSDECFLTEQPCIFCLQGMMEVWKNEKDNTYTFYCYANYNCRYSFDVDLMAMLKTLMDLDHQMRSSNYMRKR